MPTWRLVAGSFAGCGVEELIPAHRYVGLIGPGVFPDSRSRSGLIDWALSTRTMLLVICNPL